MLIVILSCLLLIALTTMIHYEVLGSLNARLPRLRIPKRSKLLVVMFAAFTAHAVEMALYGLALFVLITGFGVGTLSGPAGFSLANCLYFSAETYTSLGFGDLTPIGPIRLLAGAEALNGLLLIGWSASYAYIAMERFWNEDAAPPST
ncbi:potassium channel family protein [Roseateles toxinivorans]|uniref:Ion channel n=1 Tax=Roseateles toxinivorans TaxID=270368 RepID=A0A4R6QSG9_9BURK|nr:potassium channel family protein [Roseateles toxinivorans]TDP74277.1 ion channel [Roseateles toxinivorans]